MQLIFDLLKEVHVKGMKTVIDWSYVWNCNYWYNYLNDFLFVNQSQLCWSGKQKTQNYILRISHDRLSIVSPILQEI